MTDFENIIKELCNKSNGVFTLEDDILKSELFNYKILNISEFNKEDFSKSQIKKIITESMIDEFERNMDTYYIKTSDDAFGLAEDYEKLYEELKIVENF